MKTFYTLLLLLLGLASAHAQDVLTRRNGEEVAVKVLEITPTEIKYRRSDNPDGPLISVWRSEVFMVRYANGTKELFAPSGATLAPSVLPAAPAPAAPTVPLLPPAPPSSAVSVSDEGDAILGETVQLDGPRLGFTVLTDGVLDRAREHMSDLSPVITQFGWQFENRLFRLPNGTSALVEVVPLVGGLEQGKFLPSISGLLGMRGPKGFEMGLGPNLTPLGAGLVMALGSSYRANGVNFPINLAVVTGNGGVRISLLFGFNARHR